jgi:Mrp family chromosome partitioning ATPase
MSRMYNLMSGGPSARASAAAEPDAPWAPPPRVAAAALDDEFPGYADDAPYVEIGGPAGPVFSAGAATAVKAPKPAAVATETVVARAEPAPPPPEARTFPRLAGTPAYLSVTFHDLSGRPRAKSEVEGPDPGLVALHFPDHPVSGEYRALRDEVRAQLPDPAPRVLMFTAAAGEAGTTTVLLNLAVTLAREEAPRVLVIDGNTAPARPAGGVAAKLALKPAPGLAEVLAQQVPLAWALQPSVVPNLQVLAAGTPTADTPGLVGQELPKLVDQLRQWYDWVLVDGGVWGTAPDRDAACPAADAVYLVTRHADVDRSEFAGLRGWVRELGGLLRGYITTRA